MHRYHFTHFALSILIAAASVMTIACDDDDNGKKGETSSSLTNDGGKNGGDQNQGTVNAEENSGSQAGSENGNESGASESQAGSENGNESGASNTNNGQIDLPAATVKSCITSDDCNPNMVSYTENGHNYAIMKEMCVGGICLQTCLKNVDTVRDCTGEGEICATMGEHDVTGV